MKEDQFITKLTTPQATRIFELLLSRGEARFIGGCVRDALLDISFDDIDIATDLLPEQVMEILSAANIQVIPTGITHGTVTAILDNQSFEITTLRKDISCDGRHAEVAFTDDWRADAARRDFTINALSCTIDGTLYDYHQGTCDLENKIVRFIGSPEERICEDYLRILRFFRFCGKYGNCHFDVETVKLCKKSRYHLAGLSDERIYDEFAKIILHDSFNQVFTQMINNQILETVFPGVSLNIGQINSLKVAAEALKLLPELPVVIASMLYESGVDECRILKKKSEQKLLHFLLNFPFKEYSDIDNQIKKFHYMTGEYFKQFFLFFFALHHKTIYNRLMEDLFIIYSKKDKNIFPVTGLDLLKAGFKSGIEIGQILAKLESQWIDSDFKLSKMELLDYVNSQGV